MRIRDVEEVALAHITMGHDASCQNHFEVFRKLGTEGTWFVRGDKFPAKGIHPEISQGLEFLSSDL
jgi:hypothetical protein